MDQESVKQTLLEYGWDAAERSRITQLVHYLDEHPECQVDVAKYDRIRAALRSGVSSAQPEGGWAPFDAAHRAAVGLRRPHQWPRIVAVAAGLLLLGVLAWWQLPLTDREGVLRPDTQLAGLKFSPEEISNRAALFREVAELFDHRTSWLAVAEHASELGLGVGPAESDHQLLLVRLTMLRAGKPVSSTDLMIVPGQAAELTVPFESGARLHYLVATACDHPTRLTVWAEIRTQADAHVALATLATALPVEPGQVLGAGEMVTSDGGYQLRIGFAQTRSTGPSS